MCVWFFFKSNVIWQFAHGRSLVLDNSCTFLRIIHSAAFNFNVCCKIILMKLSLVICLCACHKMAYQRAISELHEL